MNTQLSTFTIAAIIIGLSVGVAATPYTSKFSAGFEQFLQSKRQTHKAFSEKNEALFAKSLKQDWRTFKQALVKKNKPGLKPRIQPVRNTHSNGAEAVSSSAATKPVQPLPVSRGFYGYAVPPPPLTTPFKEYFGQSQQSIVDYRQYFILHPDFTILSEYFEFLQKRYTRDFWAGLKLSTFLCGQMLKRKNSINLCSWILMHGQLLDVRLAQAKADLYLLVASKQG